MFRISYLLLLFIGCSSLSAQIVNIESLRSFTDTVGLHGEENFNIGYTRNTRELIDITNNLSLKYRKARHTLLFLNTLDVQLANEVVLEQNLFFHLRYNYRQNKWLTYEAFSQYQRNVPLRINERILAGVGPRIRILEEEKSSIFIGLIGMYEHDDELNNEIIHRDVRLSNYLTLNLAWKDRLEWSNYLYYQPRVDNWEDFRTSVQTLLKLKLLKNLAFATTLSLAYDAFPVVDPAIPQLTVKWLNGITYQF